MARTVNRRIAAAALVALTVVSAGQAFADGGGVAEDPTAPTGIGDMLPTPDLTHGDTRTLFETYSPMAYILDVDEGKVPDGLNSIFNGYANLLMLAIVAITRGAISVGWWMFSITDVQDLSEATARIITTASAGLTSWLLPSALVFGAVLAYARHRGSREGGAVSQMAWVIAAGVLAISFTTSAATWVNGADSARQLGATAVMDASSRAISANNTEPFPMPAPSYDRGSQRDKLLRQSADSTWRAFTVTPWCLAEFGSLAACERYGKAMLDRGLDANKRKDYIDKTIKAREGGSEDAPTVQWTKGKNAYGRIAVLTLGLIAAVIFAALTIVLCFAAIMAFLGVLLMLVAGVFFACLWVIPGRPRQWGVNWFETLLGLVLQSILALLVFGTALSLVTAIYSLSGSMGWLPANGLAIAVLFAAFRMRRMLEGVTSIMRPGMITSGLLGALALRQGARMVSHMFRAGKSLRLPAGGRSSVGRRLPDAGTSDDPTRIHTGRSRPGSTGPSAGQQPPSSWEFYYRAPDHQRPQLPRPVRELPPRPDSPQVAGGPDTPKLPPGPGGHPPRRPMPSGTPGAGAAKQLPAGSTRPAGRTDTARPGDSDRITTRDAAAVERQRRDPGPGRAYTPGKATSRYQTRQASSPTLREGPAARDAQLRQPRPRIRKFRRYQPPFQVAPGVTIHTPKRDRR